VISLDVRIPYLPNKELGRAYNDAMETVRSWVMFIDSDVFLRTQPKWYDICMEAIRRVGHDAGFITCVTNRIGCPAQRCGDAPKSDDIAEHIAYAEKRFQKYGYSTVEIPRVRPSGMLFITHKAAWQKAGKFPSGFLGVDNRYAGAVKNAGYKVYLMEGLYVYHSYKREWKTSRS